MISVIVDNREHKRLDAILDYYNSLEDVTCTVTTLETGDFIFRDITRTVTTLDTGEFISSDINGEVVFEYKTIPDFIASIKDMRVFNQSISMYEEFTYHYVIIVGSDLDLENAFVEEGLKPSSYYGAIAKINTYSTVITVPDEETAYSVMYCQACKCLEDKFVYKRLSMKTPNPAQNLLLMCKHIGEETVILLKEELDIYSFTDLQRLSYNDLIKIHGIGPKTANLIIDYIGETIT